MNSPKPFYPAALSLRGNALREALRRDVWTITRRGLHMTRHSPHGHAKAGDIALRVKWLREAEPAAVCLNLVSLSMAEWLLENFNPS
jgi:hypothetical protein